MDLERGFSLKIQQFRALLKKNFLLSWRNTRATSLRFFSIFFLVFIVFCIDKALNPWLIVTSNAFHEVSDSKPQDPTPIPPCEGKFFIKLPCLDFAYSGNGSSRVQSIVKEIMTNNLGRPIPSSKVKSFNTSDEVDEWLYSNPMRCPAVLHFVERNASIMVYGIQTNFTPVFLRGEYEDPIFKFLIPLLTAVERETTRLRIGDPNFKWEIRFMEFAHPMVREVSAVGTFGPTFFFAIAMLGFVFQISSSMITEKELKLRQAMTMMGLYDSAYWLSWLTWEGIVALVSSLSIVLFGMMFQFNFFLNNSFLVVFLLFFLFQLNMVGFSFMLSSFMTKSSSSTMAGFSIFLLSVLIQTVMLFGFPYSREYVDYYSIILSLFPPTLLAEALVMLSKATFTSQDPGISWSKRAECAPSHLDCVITINDIYIWLVATFCLWFVLAIYFENVIPSSVRVKKSAFYFLKPGYWTGRGGIEVEECDFGSCKGPIPSLEEITPEDEDVLEEENIIKEQRREGVVDPNIAVQICGLTKTFPGTTNISYRKCKKTSSYHAIKGLWVNVQKNQLFCLLGPNGAGKTTTINCLTGITLVTEGDAFIYGDSIRSSVGMSNIRRIVGVCPQSDILWDDLSGPEHLELFSSIKGLLPSSIKSVAQKLLAEVKFTQESKLRVGSYWGGMKRQLSIAIALIGDPKLVILDEPTTGLDEITKRHVWEIIGEAKKGRAIILTTHSIEEASILSDRIGFIVKGRFCSIGTPIKLKSRFGMGYIAHLTFTRSDEDAIPTCYHDSLKQFFEYHLDVVPKEENQAFLIFVIPHDRKALLPKFFSELRERKTEFGIADIRWGLANLEEAFSNMVKKAELGTTAPAEGGPEREVPNQPTHDPRPDLI